MNSAPKWRSASVGGQCSRVAQALCVPWDHPRMTRALFAMLAAAVLVGGCSASAAKAPTVQSHMHVAQLAADTNHVGYRGPERFCSSGRNGRLYYVVRHGKPRFRLQLTHLPARRLLGVFWASGAVHEAQLLASFRTDRGGLSRQSTVRTFLIAQRRGSVVKIVTGKRKTVATLAPCS